MRRPTGILLAALLALPLLALRPAPASPAPTATASPVPLLAYYYIWFDTRSWDRAKDDIPELGRYSSDDPAVMARHVEWAKRAGIDGFIVSWKSNPTLNRRLEQLSRIASANRFKLVLIYEGLDFHRNPLPAEQVGRDLAEAADRYTRAPAFRLFDRPVVVWSGTWKFSRAEVAQVVRPLRDRLLILASEKDPEGVRRLAGLVDGDAYYWSSADPLATPGYREKLAAMERTVHGQGGRWIAPAAPGFDARKVGGTKVVDRRDGATLVSSLGAAMASAPDAVGLISWNEFSESSYVEPSRRYGRRYLDVLASVARPPAPEAATRTTAAPDPARDRTTAPGASRGVAPEAAPGTDPAIDFASDEPAGRDDGPGRLVLLGSLLAAGLGSLGAIVWRASRRRTHP
jgi:Glycosyl hydrolase family 71